MDGEMMRETDPHSNFIGLTLIWLVRPGNGLRLSFSAESCAGIVAEWNQSFFRRGRSNPGTKDQPERILQTITVLSYPRTIPPWQAAGYRVKPFFPKPPDAWPAIRRVEYALREDPTPYRSTRSDKRFD